jgi:hypothetical protein
MSCAPSMPLALILAQGDRHGRSPPDPEDASLLLSTGEERHE